MCFVITAFCTFRDQDKLTAIKRKAAPDGAGAAAAAGEGNMHVRRSVNPAGRGRMRGLGAALSGKKMKILT
ncbi:hypothetical protein B4135_4110 [Caldibacillus debilis]|uniref:Uncharacterized protein n=1 Tax=Caldibacillus debilis TaxID=301148 RepID=A0A150L7T6_9BACI|nr:hypothetical protein B4135_4110 [Caldibacillus debilis]